MFRYFEEATINKTISEVLRVLGYLYYEEEVELPDFYSLLDLHAVERYLDWLLKSCGLQPQSIITILNTTINVIKYLSKDTAFPGRKHKDVAHVGMLTFLSFFLLPLSLPCNFANISIDICYITGVLRNVQQQVKKLIKQWHPPTQTELEKLKKWCAFIL